MVLLSIIGYEISAKKRDIKSLFKILLSEFYLSLVSIAVMQSIANTAIIQIIAIFFFPPY